MSTRPVGDAAAALHVEDEAVPAGLSDRMGALLEPELARLPYDDLLAELLRRTCEICAVDTATVLVADPVTGDLVARASVGFEDQVGQVVASGQGLAGRVAARRETLVVDEPNVLSTISPILPRLGIQSAAGAPMIVDGDLVGVVVLGSRTQRRFEQPDVDVLELCAERISLATEHHRVTSSVREQHATSSQAAARYRSLHELAAALAAAVSPQEVVDVALAHAIGALGASGGIVVTLDGDDLVLRGSHGLPFGVAERWSRFPVSSPVPIAECVRDARPIFAATADLLLQRYPVLAPDAGRYQTSASLPLVAAGRPIGAIGLLFTDVREFTDDERELIEAVVQQCTQSLARAQLYESEREATARLRFLADASGLLLSSLDYETTLRTLADAVVPAIADWCTVDIVTADDQVRRLAVAHVDPAKVALAQQINERYPLDRSAPGGLAAVLRTGELAHIPEITDEMFDAAVSDEELRQTLRDLGLRSSLIVPLVARGRILGALSLVMAESGRRYGPDEVALVQELARLAAVAVDNAELFRERSEVARALQSSLLPPVLPDVPRLQLAARYLPSGSQADVGGDFYDVFSDVGGQWAFVIGDVCGKGPEAAAVTGLARHTVRAVAQHDPAPGAVLSAVNAALLEQVPAGRFCTIGYARVDVSSDRVKVTVASGGHPLPLVRRPSGLVEAVGRPGMLVGVTTPADCPEDVVELGPGDALVLYTDGLVERHQAAGGVEDGEPALRAVLARCDDLDADGIADLILAVSFESPDSARDDVALLVIRVADEETVRA